MNRSILTTGLALALTLATGSLLRAADAVKTEPGDLKMVACPPDCGFSCTSRNEQELIDAIKAHAKTYHNMVITDEQAKSMIKAADAQPKAKQEKSG